MALISCSRQVLSLFLPHFQPPTSNLFSTSQLPLEATSISASRCQRFETAGTASAALVSACFVCADKSLVLSWLHACFEDSAVVSAAEFFVTVRRKAHQQHKVTISTFCTSIVPPKVLFHQRFEFALTTVVSNICHASSPSTHALCRSQACRSFSRGCIAVISTDYPVAALSYLISLRS
jgi:hypothetical protein